jgi:hypothetical protein
MDLGDRLVPQETPDSVVLRALWDKLDSLDQQDLLVIPETLDQQECLDRMDRQELLVFRENEVSLEQPDHLDHKASKGSLDSQDLQDQLDL